MRCSAPYRALAWSYIPWTTRGYNLSQYSAGVMLGAGNARGGRLKANACHTLGSNDSNESHLWTQELPSFVRFCTECIFRVNLT